LIFGDYHTPQSFINFQLSEEEAKEHILDLIYAQNNQGLTSAGKSKLDNYLVLEHQMTLIKQLTNTSLKI
jgi:hypothetical protein